MARGISPNLFNVCLELDANGARTSLQFWGDYKGWSHEKTRLYLHRAVKLGFATKTDARPAVYAVQPDWRARIDLYGISKAKPMVSKPRPVIPAYVPKVPMIRNSVWDLRFI